MKITYRIPGKEPFSYIELEAEVIGKMGPENIITDFESYIQASKTGDGLPKKDFDTMLDGYLRDGVVDSNEYSRCNKEQKNIMSSIKRSLSRIKHGNRNANEDKPIQ